MQTVTCDAGRGTGIPSQRDACCCLRLRDIDAPDVRCWGRGIWLLNVLGWLTFSQALIARAQAGAGDSDREAR